MVRFTVMVSIRISMPKSKILSTKVIADLPIANIVYQGTVRMYS